MFSLSHWKNVAIVLATLTLPIRIAEPVRAPFLELWKRGKDQGLRIETPTECHHFVWLKSQITKKQRCGSGRRMIVWSLLEDFEPRVTPQARSFRIQRIEGSYYLPGQEILVLRKMSYKRRQSWLRRFPRLRHLIMPDSKGWREWGRLRFELQSETTESG